MLGQFPLSVSSFISLNALFFTDVTSASAILIIQEGFAFLFVRRTRILWIAQLV